MVDPESITAFAQKNAQKLNSVGIVMTSPLLADLQTVAQLFPQSQVDIYIMPELAPRVNAADCVPRDTESNVQDLNNKVEGSVYNKNLSEDLNWYLSYGEQVPSSEHPEEDCLREMSKREDFESYEHYHKRLVVAKSSLPEHLKGGKEALRAVVAHPDVLEALTATGTTDKQELINRSPMEFLEIKKEFLTIPKTGEEVGVISHSGCCWC